MDRVEPTPTSTFGLLQRVRAGDEEAFTLLFRKVSSRLAILIHYKMSAALRGKVEVDDIVQETFMTALQQLGDFSYRNPGSFMSWLCRIAEHTIVDAARYHGRRKRGPEELLPLRTASNPAGVEPVNSTTPSRIFACRERVDQALARLDALPEEYRAVIIMAKLECLSTGEIAERLGKSRANVAVLLHRAVARLRSVAAESR